MRWLLILGNGFDLARGLESSLDNKDHGKNLVHKLLLEGRLIIKKIDFT